MARRLQSWSEILSATHLTFDVHPTFRTPEDFRGAVTRRAIGELMLVDCTSSPWHGHRGRVQIGGQDGDDAIGEHPRLPVRVQGRGGCPRGRARAGAEGRRRGAVGRSATDRCRDRGAVLQADAPVPARSRALDLPAALGAQRVAVARGQRLGAAVGSLHERARHRAAAARSRRLRRRRQRRARVAPRRGRAEGPEQPRGDSRGDARRDPPLRPNPSAGSAARTGLDRAGLLDVGSGSACPVRGCRHVGRRPRAQRAAWRGAWRTCSGPTAGRSPTSRSAGASATPPTSRACSSGSSAPRRARSAAWRSRSHSRGSRSATPSITASGRRRSGMLSRSI